MIRAGFEPTTHSLEGCCSIQLSYRTLYSVIKNNARRTAKFLFFLEACKNTAFFLKLVL